MHKRVINGKKGQRQKIRKRGKVGHNEENKERKNKIKITVVEIKEKIYKS